MALLWAFKSLKEGHINLGKRKNTQGKQINGVKPAVQPGVKPAVKLVARPVAKLV